MKIVNLIFFILFLFSVIVQYNDPDPIRWMAIYGLAAFVCGLHLFNKKTWYIPPIIGGIAFLWIIAWFPKLLDTPTEIVWSDVFGHAEMKTDAVEITREIFGLFLVFIWMGVLMLTNLKDKVNTKNSN